MTGTIAVRAAKADSRRHLSPYEFDGGAMQRLGTKVSFHMLDWMDWGGGFPLSGKKEQRGKGAEEFSFLNV